MKALFFRCHGVRYRLTQEPSVVPDKVWVLERAGKTSESPGTVPVRHCWTAPADSAGLAGLVVAATEW